MHEEKSHTATIVICTKDRAQDLKKCLDSISGQSRFPEQIVVVDSGTDDAPEIVASFASRHTAIDIQYIHSEPGLTKQRNIGINAANGDVIHFFDDDVTLNPDYLQEIQYLFDRDATLLGAGPKVVLAYTPSPLGRIWRRIFLLPDVAGSGRLLRSGFGSYTWYTRRRDVHDVEILCGCCCAFRKNVFEKVRFDEYFAGYGYLEDLDFSYRVASLGKLVTHSGAVIEHWESPSARTNWRRLAAMQIVNHAYVFRKLLPQDLYHRACFWWSELGESIRRLGIAVRTRNADVVRGMVDGYRAILRG